MSQKCGNCKLLRSLLVVICGFCAIPVFAQQSIAFDTAIPFDSTFNEQAEVLSPLLSIDRKTLYFVKAFSKENIGGDVAGTDVWFSTKDSLNQWSPPSNKNGRWNNQDNNAIIGVRNDGEVVYLLNSYKKGSGVSFSKKVNGKWSAPEFIAIPGIGSNSFIGFYMAESFDVLLLSMEGNKSFGQEDIYVSLRDSTDKWGKPINLGPTINTNGYEISPFLSRDKSTLYFSSDGHGGEGGADIFMSRRLYDSWTVWSKPINLGKMVNSDVFDAYFSIYQDSISYFVSNRNSPTAKMYSSKVIKEKEIISIDAMTRIVESSKRPDRLKFDVGPSIIVYFDSRRYDLDADSKIKIDQFIDNAMVSGNTHFHISGSGDSGLQAEANSNLASWRIFSAISVLLKKEVRVSGISAERVTVSPSAPELFGIIRIQAYKEL